jgi:hypothetical protein
MFTYGLNSMEDESALCQSSPHVNDVWMWLI